MSDADVALSAVIEGAAVVRGLFGTAVERFDKGGGDFATSADVDAEAAMLAVLRRERPDDSIWGEESGASGASGSARRWLIDPLCGTLNYAAGMQVVAVNAALSTPQGVLAAAVADPFAGTAVWTDGVAAWVRNDTRDVPAAPSADSHLVDLNLDPPFPNADAFRAVNLAADPQFATQFRPRVVSSTLAVAWVATGQRAGWHRPFRRGPRETGCRNQRQVPRPQRRGALPGPPGQPPTGKWQGRSRSTDCLPSPDPLRQGGPARTPGRHPLSYGEGHLREGTARPDCVVSCRARFRG